MKLYPQKIKKIAILRALQLGDLLCAIPAIRALRQAYPHAHITLLGLPWAAALQTRFPHYFDEVIHFPGYPGLPEQDYHEAQFNLFLNKMQAENYDLVVQMQGNGTIVNDLLPLFGAKQIAGFYPKDSPQPGDLFVPYPDDLPEPLRHLHLMKALGISSTGPALEFPIYPDDEKKVYQLFLPVTPQSYIIIHPGSRGGWRQWPPQYFALIADYCIENGFTVMITGTPDEKNITTEVMKRMRHTAIDLTGRTGLGQAAVLIRDAFLLVANCTGVSHIASATRTRSVIISMDGEPGRWSPLDKRLHRVIDWTTQPGLNSVFDAVNFFLLQSGRKQTLQYSNGQAV